MEFIENQIGTIKRSGVDIRPSCRQAVGHAQGATQALIDGGENEIALEFSVLGPFPGLDADIHLFPVDAGVLLGQFFVISLELRGQDAHRHAVDALLGEAFR